MRRRIAISAAIGIASGTFCWFLARHFHLAASDFGWALRLARRLVAHQSPYDTPLEQYPVTAALFALPLVKCSPEVAAGLFWGISSFLLALGLTGRGYSRLLVFLAYPYCAGMLVVQWSTIITASAFFPLLLPVTLAKPQIGLPVFLTRLSRRGVLACVVLVALTLIWMPTWPILWVHQWRNYEHFVPLLVLPGPLLMLALIRYRDPDAMLLVLAALMPQRWFFDSFILWLIPKTRKEILFTILFSWGAILWRWNNGQHDFAGVGRGAIFCIYLPMLAVILWRGRAGYLTGDRSVVGSSASQSGSSIPNPQ